MKVAIVVAYRKEEKDLAETVKSATAAMGKKGGSIKTTLVSVEDKDNTGPGANRHRGIEAATDAEIIILIDAHMRFRGNVLRSLATDAMETGDLLVPFCHHNPLCKFQGRYERTTGVEINATGELPGSGDAAHFYAGARIVYRAKDGTEKKPLDAKWSRINTPGPRGCVMGACYAFRRDWYISVGQPLAILNGWGGDEQALSIASWLSGHTPRVVDGHVAHLYRSRPSWPVGFDDQCKVAWNQQAIVAAVVTDAGARLDLETWAGWATRPRSAALERFRLALLQQPRKWRDWRAEVCEPEEINGVQEPRNTLCAGDPAKSRQTPVPNPTVPAFGFTCPHCRKEDSVARSQVLNTYPNGNRRRRCLNCGNPFIEMARKEVNMV